VLAFSLSIFMPMSLSRKLDRGTPTLSDGDTAISQCPEPSVDEMVDDPIVRALMAADGVDPRELRRLLQSIAARLHERRVEDRQIAPFHDRPTQRNPRREKRAIDAD
jgi:hypothetical protein